MSKKQILEIDFEIDFFLLGVGCHLKDYRFIWNINKTLKTNFFKTKQSCLYNKKNLFSQYNDNSDSLITHVFSNKSPKGYLIPTKKNVDFWIKTSSFFQEKNLKVWLEKIRAIKQVLAVYKEDDEKIKEQFLFE